MLRKGDPIHITIAKVIILLGAGLALGACTAMVYYHAVR